MHLQPLLAQCHGPQPLQVYCQQGYSIIISIVLDKQVFKLPPEKQPQKTQGATLATTVLQCVKIHMTIKRGCEWPENYTAPCSGAESPPCSRRLLRACAKLRLSLSACSHLRQGRRAGPHLGQLVELLRCSVNQHPSTLHHTFHIRQVVLSIFILVMVYMAYLFIL